jgi:hypothetical protein
MIIMKVENITALDTNATLFTAKPSPKLARSPNTAKISSTKKPITCVPKQ